MEQFITYAAPIIEKIMPYAVGTIIAVFMYIKFWLDNKRLKEQLGSIEDQLQHSDNEYYVICPTCGSKLMLAKLKIYIEQKSKEDDDNGNRN